MLFDLKNYASDLVLNKVEDEFVTYSPRKS